MPSLRVRVHACGVCVHACMCVCMWCVCVHACMCVCACGVCVCMRACVCACGVHVVCMCVCCVCLLYYIAAQCWRHHHVEAWRAGSTDT